MRRCGQKPTGNKKSGSDVKQCGERQGGKGIGEVSSGEKNPQSGGVGGVGGVRPGKDAAIGKKNRKREMKETWESGNN